MEVGAMFTAGKERNLKSEDVLQETAAEVINVSIAYFEANEHSAKKNCKRKTPTEDEETRVNILKLIVFNF